MQTAYKYRFSSDKLRKPKVYPLRAKVWMYSGPAAWYFVTLPKQTARDIRAQFGFNAKGWGSLPVEAAAGEVCWRTSIFPDKKSASYLLPLKADIRKKAGIKKGAILSLSLTLGA